MRILLKNVMVLAWAVMVFSAQAQTLVDSWTYAGGGLDPATYGSYTPTTLVADTSANNGATIGIAGTMSGVAGLGHEFFDDYEGFYAFSSALSYTLSSGTILSGVQSISFSFVSYDYVQGSLLLDYNGSHTNLTSTSFATPVSLPAYPSPIGPVDMFRYTWTWDVSTLGSTTGFDIKWAVASGSHNFMMDFHLTQAVPEPSVAGLMALGPGVLWLLRGRRNRRSAAVDAQ